MSNGRKSRMAAMAAMAVVVAAMSMGMVNDAEARIRQYEFRMRETLRVRQAVDARIRLPLDRIRQAVDEWRVRLEQGRVRQAADARVRLPLRVRR